MAEYIDRKRINLFGFFDAGDYSQAMRCINNMPTADVVEREKIDKAIEEIEQAICSYGFCFVSRGMNLALDILKKNIGENK